MGLRRVATLSPPDSERFGISVARAEIEDPGDVADVLESCRQQAVTLLIARCPTTDIAAAQALERAGSRLMDVLVSYAGDLDRERLPSPNPAVRVVPVTRETSQIVTDLAAETFRGYPGHYRADPRLDPEQCDQVYVSWLQRSLSEYLGAGDAPVREHVLVVERDAEIVGFVSVGTEQNDEARMLLGSVASNARGAGVYRDMIAATMHWCASRGMRRIRSGTQIGNVAVQRTWPRLGLALTHSVFTFHKWLDEDPTNPS